jgi:hypothetical protein
VSVPDMILEHRGVIVQHNMQRWSVKRNRHPTTRGYAWGWIEGSLNVCWDNEGAFTECVAEEISRLHNEWLDRLRPVEVRIIEARCRLRKAQDEVLKAGELLAAADRKVRDIAAELDKLEGKDQTP